MNEAIDDLNSLSVSFLEGLYEDFQRDPNSVAPEWRQYFGELTGAIQGDGANGAGNGVKHSPLTREAIRPAAHEGPNGAAAKAESSAHAGGKAESAAHAGSKAESAAHAGNGDVGAMAPPRGGMDLAQMQDRVDSLIRAYRVRGHMIASIDPLNLRRMRQPELDPEFYGFTQEDLDRTFSTRTIRGPDALSLREVIERMNNTYCRWIGVQYMHIDEISVRNWLQDRMEGTENRFQLSREEQLRILTRLTDATIFEEFVQKKFIGAKSFSLEGAESLIPLLDLAIEKAGEQGIEEIVLGMAHRGRLNVLANIMGKNYRQIFREFEDVDVHEASGDVKYHLGHSTDWVTASGQKVHLSLCFNPSHLEFVNPVALGRMRAKQDRIGDKSRERGMALLVHGDAAFAGEGVLQETFNLSGLKGYHTGGTLHVVVNNQIGFTTSPGEGRSSPYATDVAKLLQSPIFHVNGEHPEAVAQVVRLAMDFRRVFKRDVVIDMYCYRRRGHNEQDEPAFTQPLLYKAIENRKSVREAYLDHLYELGGVAREEAEAIATARREHMEQELTVARSKEYIPRAEMLTRIWSNYKGGPESNADEPETGVPKDRLSQLLEIQSNVCEGMTCHAKLARLLGTRMEMAHGKRPLDWAAGEALALGSLATQGIRIRLSGQDAARGTFSHRHAVLHDVENGRSYTPLKHLSPDQAPVEIINSPLSEIGVLGFDYGYSLDWPEALVMWEAQFGDFVNVAQVIIDQFICSAEEKWGRLSGLVMLLPHGFEGQGPEHSSARLERFLTLGAEDNIQVVNTTTPAQYFHLLRRQALRKWRKPLVIMTPKSLLRLPEATSSLEECERGVFQRVLPDVLGTPPADVRRILMCSGKVYYDLAAERKARKRDDVAILRVEQLYPLPEQMLREILAPYKDGTSLFWVQEEPENMGAWRYIRVLLGENVFGRFTMQRSSRPAAASPATGHPGTHKAEQKELIARAFDG